jgi:hypothetical protein
LGGTAGGEASCQASQFVSVIFGRLRDRFLDSAEFAFDIELSVTLIFCPYGLLLAQEPGPFPFWSTAFSVSPE